MPEPWRYAVADPAPEPDAPATAPDPLRLVLHTMEEQLDDRVSAVSDAGPSREESTAELIRLEETLSSAQDKAKQLVTLRLKLEEDAAAGADSAAAAGRPSAGDEAPQGAA